MVAAMRDHREFQIMSLPTTLAVCRTFLRNVEPTSRHLLLEMQVRDRMSVPTIDCWRLAVRFSSAREVKRLQNLFLERLDKARPVSAYPEQGGRRQGHEKTLVLLETGNLLTIAQHGLGFRKCFQETPVASRLGSK